MAMIPNTWGEFDPIRMFHHAVMGGAVDTMQMLLAAYPEAGLEKRVRLMGLEGALRYFGSVDKGWHCAAPGSIHWEARHDCSSDRCR